LYPESIISGEYKVALKGDIVERSEKTALGRHAFARLKNKASWAAGTALATSLLALTVAGPVSAKPTKNTVISTISLGAPSAFKAMALPGSLSIHYGESSTFCKTIMGKGMATSKL
jgi:hypothetical protein